MYVYNDEDNAPMNDFDHHNPTVYLSEFEARMHDKYGEPEPVKKPSNGCWNCMDCDPGLMACTKCWNNLDKDYYNPDRDDVNPTDICDDWRLDPDADPEDWFGGDEK